MICDYFNEPYSLKTISTISRYRQKGGLTNDDLAGIISRMGFVVRTNTNTSWSDLRKYNKKGTVVVLSWMLNGYIGHFSLLDSVGKDAVHLADPHTGALVRMRKIVFLRLWFDYDGKWYPKTNSDISLRWAAVVSKE